MLSVGLLDKSALLDEYAPMYVEDFEADLETDAFQQKLFQAWDELGGDEDWIKYDWFLAFLYYK